MKIIVIKFWPERQVVVKLHENSLLEKSSTSSSLTQWTTVNGNIPVKKVFWKKIPEKNPQNSGVMTPCPVGGVITLCL